ncbi:MAG TPA: enoyl-CoA hydratase-related protein [Pseudolabrys sp.]|nr:enoyl-CoA hydratase-related protein [Pseudolabrys sp.]
MSYETLLIDTSREHILLVTLNRPASANAMNTQMGLDLRDLFTRISREPEAHRAIVLTGAGNRAFCAGADLKERNDMSDDAWQAQHLIYEQMIRAIIECPVPLIAAVNGAAYAGGLEIALGCDFIFASKAARFALTEVSLGIMPGAGGTQNLARAIGERRAKELILSAHPIDAALAYEWGMLNRLCEPDAVLTEALDVAQKIARNAPISVRQAKKAIHTGYDLSLADGMIFEIECYHRMVPTADRIEGIRAFNEKRTPVFKGR